jgi:excisionase family DNA binding protein
MDYGDNGVINIVTSEPFDDRCRGKEHSMDKEIRYYSTQEIAALLGVSSSSIERWVDSGKLKCSSTKKGEREFSVDHLKEFAITYNISMKFLDTIRTQTIKQGEKTYTSVAAV